MTKGTWLFAGLILVLTACGGSEPPADIPPGPAAAGTGPVAVTLSPEMMTLRDSEWFTASGNRISAVTGRVTDHTGRPLGGASVSLLVPSPIPMAPSLEFRAIRADEGGVFRFADVPRNARVQVSAEGSADRMVEAMDLLGADGDPVEIRLPVPGAIRAQALTRGGEPVSGVDFLLTSFKDRFVAVATTDDEGRVHFPSVPPTEVSPRLLSRDHASRLADTTVRSGETTEFEVRTTRPMPVTLEVTDRETGRPIPGVVGAALYVREECFAGDAEGRLVVEGACFRRVWLRADGYEETPTWLPKDRTAPQTIRVRMRRAASAYGRVLDEDGQPVAEVRVRAQLLGHEEVLTARGPLTGADGSFAMSWIPTPGPGEGVLFAEKPGWYLKSSAVVPLARGKTAPAVTIVLGRLQRATLRLLDAEGAPVTHALVKIRGIEPFRAGDFPTFTTDSLGRTDADGHLTLYGVAPQRVELSVQVPGRFTWRELLDLGRSESFDLGDIRVPVGETVAGRIRSTSGQIPAGTSVSLSVGDQSIDVPVAGDGSFRCVGLPEGPVDLRVKTGGHRPQLRTVKAGDEDLDIVIVALGSIKVAIVRPENASIRGVLELRPVGGSVQNRIATTRRLEGRVDSWKFPNLLAGVYRLRIHAGDFFARAEVKLAHGAHAEAELVLRKGARVQGTLRLPDGGQAVETGVSLICGEGQERRSAVTDGFGRFEFRGVPPGDVTLVSHPTGHAEARRTVSVRAGEATETELALRAGGRIEVSITDESGAAVPEVRVTLDGTGGPARFWVEGGGPNVTDDEGGLILTGVEPGEYGLSLFRSGVRRPWGKVSVTEGGTARVDVVWK